MERKRANLDRALKLTKSVYGSHLRNRFRVVQNERFSATHGSNYRAIKSMAYTKKYAPGTPNSKIARFTTGKYSTDYNYIVKLISKGRVQIRSNALESARVAANKKLAS